ALANEYGVTVDSAQVGEVVTGLVTMIISTFVVIMDGILIYTLGNLGATILWHALFKHFISKRVRKVVRVKGVSMLMGVSKSVLVGSLLILPFSSLINNVVSAYQDEDNGVTLDNELLSNITTFVDAYDNSVLANVLFNWTENSAGQSWDVQLMDSLTSVDVDGVKASFIDELYNLVGIGKTLTSAGIFEEGAMEKIGQTILMNEDMTVSLLSSIGNSGLVLMLLPIAAEMALNHEAVQAWVGDDLLDISDVDWRSEINNIGDMYKAVVKTGLFEEMVDEEGNFRDLKDMDISVLFELDTYSGMMDLFASIGDSKLLSRAIPAVAYTMVQNNPEAEYANFLPKEWPDYNAIDWGGELSIVYDALFRINALDTSLLPALLAMSAGGGGEGDPAPEPAIQKALSTAKLGAPYMSEEDILKVDALADGDEATETNPIEIILKNASSVKTILVGNTDANGNPLGVDANGVTRVFDEEGNRLYNRHYCLFDSQLLQYSLEGAITLLIQNFLAGQNLEHLDFAAVFDELNTGVPLLNYKKEYGAILDLFVVLGRNEATRALALDFEGMPGITFNEEGGLESIDSLLLEGLRTALPKLDNSRFMSLILPELLRGVFEGEQMKGMFDAIGIDSASLNWDTPRLGRELSLLLDAFGDVQELMSIMEPFQDDTGEVPPGSFGDLMFALSQNDEPLARMLDTLYLSNIINEKYQEDVYNTFGVLLHSKGEMVDGTNSNFYGMLDFVFEGLLGGNGFSNKKDIYTVPRWNNSRTIDGDFRRDINGNAIYDGETGFMTDFISACGRTRLLDIIDVGAGESIDYGNLGDAVSEVFTAVEQSRVFSATFGDVLDLYIRDQLTDDPGEISFNNVHDWSLEGEAFRDMCYAIENFGAVDFADIDFIGSDPDNVVALLSSLADSQMFDGESGYLFGDFFYSQLMTSLGSNKQYFYDPDATTTLEVESDFDSLSTRPEWQEEITLFGAALEALQASNVDSLGNPIDTSDPVDYLGLLTTGKVTGENVGNILTSLNNTTTMRMIIYNGFAQIGGAFASDQIDLSTMNNKALVGMSRAQRQEEIDIVVEMYAVIENIGQQDPVTGDYSYDINLRTTPDEDIDG
ncbi:MAG: hypothetical protein WC282_04335, partial [Bacilli bacterium]